MASDEHAQAASLLPLTNDYAQLPGRFYARVAPTPVPSPHLIRLNRPLARELGLGPDALSSQTGVEVLSGNRLASAHPIAAAYAGHQFGGFVPQLGDGRAILLGERVGPGGERFDVQLKGAGRTPFSRGGDGRAPLGPVLREYVVSEAMAALGIPTTRALAAVATGEQVIRQTVQPGAILTRVASSHVRVGTFEYFAARDDQEALRLLADHVIDRHYPDAARSDQPYLALLTAVAQAQAHLIARWMLVGFVHGVMNTDNASVAGETIDYGPCAFLDAYDPHAVFSSIDRGGRYAYDRQPAIGRWNLARLAECLLPLLSDDTDAAVAQAQQALAGYDAAFERAYRTGLHAKLGLLTSHPGDQELADELLALMAGGRADFTLTFRRLSESLRREGEGEDVGGGAGTGTPSAGVDATMEVDAGDTSRLFAAPSGFLAWQQAWRARIADEPSGLGAIRDHMLARNPVYVPRNHLVEAALSAATEGDYAPFHRLVEVLQAPFQRQPGSERFADAPADDQRVYRTFCGT